MHIKLAAVVGSCVFTLMAAGCGKSGGDDAEDMPMGTPTASGGSGALGAAGTPETTPQPSGGSGGATTVTITPSTAGTGGSGTGGTPAASGTGGATETLGTGGTGSMQNAMPYPDPRGKCTIDSGFPGDEACILPPDPSEGMQIHIGPTDYNDSAQIDTFVMKPGDESSQCYSFHTPNDEDIYYQTYTLSGRAGTHHIINTMYKEQVEDGGFVACLNEFSTDPEVVIDSLPGASRAYHERPIVAPENEHVGRKVPKKSSAQADMHYFNFTETDILREFWMNIYYAPKAQITDEAKQIRGMGGTNWSFEPIQPGTDMVYQYSCPIEEDGRIIQLLGHYHAHGKRFTVYLNHGGQRQKVFEMYDYQDPRTFQYDSVTTNPAFSDNAAGASSGQLLVKAGDTLDWECHIVNDSQVGLTYTNMVQTGEMCNVWGASVGPKISCYP